MLSDSNDSDDSVVFVGYGKKRSRKLSNPDQQKQRLTNRENSKKKASFSNSHQSSSTSAASSSSAQKKSSSQIKLNPPFDRVQPEEEDSKTHKAPKSDYATDSKATDAPDTQKRKPSGEAGRFGGATGKNGIQLSTVAPIRSEDRFWEGGVKLSYNVHAPEELKGIKFSELFLPATLEEPNGLRRMLLASYQYPVQWMKKSVPKNVPVTLIGRESYLIFGAKAAKPRTLPRNWKLGQIPENFSFKGNPSCQHAKFMLLSFKTHLRFVVMSGNMDQVSWNVSENTCLIFDAPRITPEERGLKLKRIWRQDSPLAGNQQFSLAEDFYEQILRFLNSLGQSSNAIYQEIQSRHFDFSKVPFQLVSSIPGPLEEQKGWDEIHKHGVARLRKVSQNFGFNMSKLGVYIEAQGSALGNHTRNWLGLFESLCSGMEHLMKFQREPNIKILFPSQSWFDSKAYDTGAGFYGKIYPNNGLTDFLHQPVSRRAEGIKIHSKSILVLQPNLQLNELEENLPSRLSDCPPGFKSKVVGTCYLGSANFNPAAWGSIGGEDNAPIVWNPKNWELGVVLPITYQDLNSNDQVFALFRGFLPYKRDFQRYEQGDFAYLNPEEKQI